MKLSEICKEIKYECLKGSMETEIRDIIYDSRKLTEGTMFVCMVGAVTDGHKYIPDAVEKGASAIVVERGEEGARFPGGCALRISGPEACHDRHYRNEGQDDDYLYD